MSRSVVRLTMAQALVRYLCNQFTEIDGERVPLFAGVFAIFGHGNVTCLSEALEAAQDRLPTWRGQNEQSMALARSSSLHQALVWLRWIRYLNGRMEYGFRKHFVMAQWLPDNQRLGFLRDITEEIAGPGVLVTQMG